MPPVKRRTPDLRERILAGSIQLLAAEGPEGFTTRKVAELAQTSTPAIYELFGDKGGLLREVFFSGFHLLNRAFTKIGTTEDPVTELIGLAQMYRAFARENQMLVQIMFARPFTEFEPAPDDLAATASVRMRIVAAVQRCIDRGRITGDATDNAHVFVALIQGLAAAENSHRLGHLTGDIDRRWDLALRSLLNGIAPCQKSVFN
jgi:AcrR family transcriptional regulator